MDCSITDPKDMGVAAGSASSHHIESAGWDDKEYYFIEKAMLDWNETDGNTIVMRSAIRLDSVLFCAPGPAARRRNRLAGSVSYSQSHR